MRTLVTDMRERWQFLDQRIAALDAEFSEQARSDESARRLTTIPGIGALNATALVAAIGDVTTFARRRDLAAWLERARISDLQGRRRRQPRSRHR